MIALETLRNSLLDSEILSPRHLLDLEALGSEAPGTAAAARPREGRASMPMTSVFSRPGEAQKEWTVVPGGPCVTSWDCPWIQMSC